MEAIHRRDLGIAMEGAANLEQAHALVA
jgi:hypothetical protein